MGTLCQILAVLSYFIYSTHCNTATTAAPVEDETSTVYKEFLATKDDFINTQDNALYYPLTASLSLKLGTDENIGSTLESLLKQTETFSRGYRNYMLLNETKLVVSEAEISSFLPLKLDATRTSVLLAGQVTSYPTDLAALHRISTAMKTRSLADKETFLKYVVLPAMVEADLEFVAGYRWNLSTISDDLSMKALSKLPVDSILAMTKDIFTSQDMKTKLTDKENLVAPSSSLSSWYALAQQYLEESVFVENFDAYSEIILTAPINKMLANMKKLKASERIKVLKDHDLDPVRVQAIWDSIDADSLTAENINEQQIANLFFSVGSKLDIAQIDEFYTKTFVHLYSKRHEVEELWVHNDKVNLPWPVLKYISKVHWPSVTTDKWGQKELIDLGAFGVGLTRNQLEKIPAPAFASLSTLEHFFSDRLSLGQLFVIFDKMNEASKSEFALPKYLYPCLHSSLLSGKETVGNMKIGQKAEDMVKASVKFTPAQRMAYFNHLKKQDLWKKQTVSLILLNNPSLLSEISNKEFTDNLNVLREGIWFSGRDNLDQVVKAIRMLPRRLLSAWLESTVISDKGELDVDKLLDKTTSNKDHFTTLQSSDSASSIALPGLCCHMIGKIPMDRLMEVLSTYRFSMPGEVIHSDARMCFVSAIRQYLRTKSVGLGMELSSEIELLSLLSSSDIRAIGAELLLSWGGQILTNIPHPEVSYEVMLKISEENPHLFFHNGVSFDDVKLIAKQMLKTSKDKNNGNIDFGVLKRMRDLLPYLDTGLQVSQMDVQQFFRSAYTSPMNKAICVPDAYRQRFRDLIVKGFGVPSEWSADVLVTLGDLMVVLSENDLYSIDPLALRKALPSLVKSSVYSGVHLPEVRGFVEPQLYYKACEQWLTATNDKNTFTPAWEGLARCMVSGANLLMSVQPTSPKAGARRKREVTSTYVALNDLDVQIVYKKVNELVLNSYISLPKQSQTLVFDVLRKYKTRLAQEAKQILGDVNDLNRLMNPIGSTQHKNGLKLASEKTKISVIKDLVSILNLNAEDLGIEEPVLAKIMSYGELPQSLKRGVDIVGDILTRTKRDLTGVNFMNLHDKVMGLLVNRFSGLTLLEQEASKEIIQESQELIGNGTLSLLGLDPTTLSLSQADVLSTIENAKTKGMTAEQEAGIVQIARDAQVRLIQELSNLLSLTADELEITQETFDEIKALETFVDTEKFMSTAVYEFTTVAGVTEASLPTETTTKGIKELVKSEEKLVHAIFEEIPKLSTIEVTCDIIKTAEIAASMITSEDIERMAAQDVTDCIETFGNLNYTPEKAGELWPAIKQKLNIETTLSEGQMVLLKNLLPAVVKYDLEMLDLVEANIDGVSVVGEVAMEVDNEDLVLAVAKYMKNKGGAVTVFELQTLGRLLCGLTEHAWHRIAKETVLSALPQILPINCHLNQPEIIGDLKKKISIDDVKLVGELNWLAPFIYSSNLSQLKFNEISGAGARNLGDLSIYSADQLVSLSPQAASVVPLEHLRKLDDVKKLTALAKSGGEGPQMRSLLTAKLTAKLGEYPVPVMTRKEVREARTAAAAAAAKQKDADSSSPCHTASAFMIVCVVFSLYL